MKRQNKSGPAVLGYPLPELPEVEAAELADRIESGDAIVVDTRHHSEVHEGTVKDAVHQICDSKTAEKVKKVSAPARLPTSGD